MDERQYELLKKIMELSDEEFLELLREKEHTAEEKK